MFKVAIVEDQEEDCKLLRNYLCRYEQEKKTGFHIDIFHDGMSFVSEYKPVYDIVFMDIGMPQMDGLSAAKFLRKMDEYVCLVFITNMAQYAINGYEVNAVDFLVKPIVYFRFAVMLEKAIWNSGIRRKRYVGIETQEGLVKVSFSQIFYVESEKHYVTFHTREGDIRSRGSIRDIAERLSGGIFARCHASYLVNLDYVMRVELDKVILQTGDLPLSRTYKKEFLDEFTRYLGGIH